jgi:hypothetical protein
MDELSHTEGAQLRLLLGEMHLAHYVLNLTSVLIMNYGQFHTLHGAIKERVASIKVENALSSQIQQPAESAKEN